MGLHEKTAEVFYCVLHLVTAQTFCKISWLWGLDSGLVRLECNLIRLPLQTLRILHLPGNEISKLEDPAVICWDRHISQLSPIVHCCKNVIPLHGRVLNVGCWD